MMRVAVIAGQLGPRSGGAGRVALAQAQFATDLGHDVTLVSADTDNPSATLNWRPLTRDCRRELAAYDLLHLHRVRNVWPRVLPLLRGDLPAVMTLHDNYLACAVSSRLYGDGSPCQLRACRASTVLARNCGGSRARGLASLAEFGLRDRLTSQLDAVRVFISPSRFVIDLAVAAGYSQDRFAHVVNPVEPWTGPPRSERSGSVAFLGRLENGKGLQDLGLLAASGLEIDCYGLRDEAEPLPVGVRHLGVLAADQVLGVLQDYRALVFPSRHEENCPLVVLEAFSAGALVCGYDVGGVRELVGDDQRGLLVPRGDVTGLQQALESAIELTRANEDKVTSARAFADSVASPETCRSRLADVYERASATQ